MDHNFIINLDSIDKFARETRNTSLRLEEIINYLIRITGEMDEFFDTPSANIMRDALLKYLNNAKIPCNKLGDLSNKIELFNANYISIYGETKASVGDNK